MKMNEVWHRDHVMPKNPSSETRIAWHLDHARHCGCRPIPRRVQEEIDKRRTP